MFCGKFCICFDICLFIVVKIKYMNSGRVGDICYKVNFTRYYTHFTTPNMHFIKTHTNITIFYIFDRTVPQRDLRISQIIKQAWMENTTEVKCLICAKSLKMQGKKFINSVEQGKLQ